MCVYVLSCSVVSNPATPWTVVHQASLFMGFFKQEYWSRLPFLLLKGIFQIQGLNPCLLSLLHWHVDFYHWATYTPIKKNLNIKRHFFFKEGRGRILWIIVSLLHSYKPSKMWTCCCPDFTESFVQEGI